MRNKYKLFVSTEEPADNSESLEEMEEELKNLNACMCEDDSFVIMKNGKFYCKGSFNKEKYKLRTQSD